MRTKFASLLAATFVFGVTQAASAADIPRGPMVTKAPPLAPVMLWNGCYIGVNGGYGWAHKRGTIVEPGLDPEPAGSHTADGGVAGGQIGCDWQVNPTWVIGVRGMYDWASLRGSNVHPVFPDLAVHTKVNGFGTAVVRAGWLFSPNTMLYVLGGLAWVHDRHHITEFGIEGANARKTRLGFDVGVGLEHMINPGWSLFVEYDYMGFGTKRINFATITGDVIPVDVKQDVQKILVGLNWRWGAGTGVAARW